MTHSPPNMSSLTIRSVQWYVSKLVFAPMNDSHERRRTVTLLVSCTRSCSKDLCWQTVLS